MSTFPTAIDGIIERATPSMQSAALRMETPTIRSSVAGEREVCGLGLEAARCGVSVSNLEEDEASEWSG